MNRMIEKKNRTITTGKRVFAIVVIITSLFTSSANTSAQSRTGGNTGGGPKINGVPLITYLRKSKFSQEKILGLITGVMKRVEKVDPELAEALKAGVHAIDWYKVNVKLDKLPYSITQLPFDKKNIDQMMVQNDGRVFINHDSFEALLAKARASGNFGLIEDAIIPELFEYNFLEALNVNTHLTPKSYQKAALLITSQPLPSKEVLRKKLAEFGFTVNASKIQAKKKQGLEKLAQSTNEEIIPVSITLSTPIRLKDAREAQGKCLAGSKNYEGMLRQIGEQFESDEKIIEAYKKFINKDPTHPVSKVYFKITCKENYESSCIEYNPQMGHKYMQVNFGYANDEKTKYFLKPSYGSNYTRLITMQEIRHMSTELHSLDSLGKYNHDKLSVVRVSLVSHPWFIETTTDFPWITHNLVETDTVYDHRGDVNQDLRLKDLAFMVPKSVYESGKLTFQTQRAQVTVPVVIDANAYMACVTNEMQALVKARAGNSGSAELTPQEPTAENKKAE